MRVGKRVRSGAENVLKMPLYLYSTVAAWTLKKGYVISFEKFHTFLLCVENLLVLSCVSKNITFFSDLLLFNL